MQNCDFFINKNNYYSWLASKNCVAHLKLIKIFFLWQCRSLSAYEEDTFETQIVKEIVSLFAPFYDEGYKFSLKIR